MRFTEEHEWLRPDDDEDDVIVVGLTEFGVGQLGELVFVELPEEGQTVTREDSIVVVESDQSTTDITAPLDGEIVEVNDVLLKTPTLVNEDPLGDGWFFKMRVEDMGALSDFMTEAEYKKFI